MSIPFNVTFIFSLYELMCEKSNYIDWTCFQDSLKDTAHSKGASGPQPPLCVALYRTEFTTFPHSPIVCFNLGCNGASDSEQSGSNLHRVAKCESAEAHTHMHTHRDTRTDLSRPLSWSVSNLGQIKRNNGRTQRQAVR